MKTKLYSWICRFDWKHMSFSKGRIQTRRNKEVNTIREEMINIEDRQGKAILIHWIPAKKEKQNPENYTPRDHSKDKVPTFSYSNF